MSGLFLTLVLCLCSYGDYGIRVGTHADFIPSLAVTSQKIYFEMIKDYPMIVIRNFFWRRNCDDNLEFHK